MFSICPGFFVFYPSIFINGCIKISRDGVCRLHFLLLLLLFLHVHIIDLKNLLCFNIHPHNQTEVTEVEDLENVEKDLMEIKV